MSKLGIGLFYFALVGALAAAIFGYLLIQKYQTSQSTLATTRTSLASEQKAVKVADKKADDATKAADDANTALTEEKSKTSDLTDKLSDAQKKQDDLTTQLTSAKSDADAAKKALDDLKAELPGSPDEIKANLAKAQTDLASANSQLKIAQDQVQAQTVQITNLKGLVDKAKTGTMPPGISGKVTFVNVPWNFVVLNVGLSNGVVPNGELIVYRDRNFLGKIKITSAEDNTAVGDILPGTKHIEVGDDVLN